jgi:hypothetical protein
MAHSLVLTIVPPATYKAAVVGTNGGTIPARTAGQFLISNYNVPIASGTASANYTTDAGDSGIFPFAFDPDTQELDAACVAAIQALDPSATITVTYQ